MAKKKGNNTNILLGLTALAGVGVYSFLKLRNIGKQLQVTPNSVKISKVTLSQIEGNVYLNVVNASSVRLKISSVAGTASYKGDTVINFNIIKDVVIEPKSKMIVAVPFQISTIQLATVSYTLVQAIRSNEAGQKMEIEGVATTNLGSATFKDTIPLSFGPLGTVLAKKTTKTTKTTPKAKK